ncbi:MAG: hypothetical protein M9894_36510 [Planctomycetes bacterium]|nr:hypothetical protein [Planctomycetota bacterium]
MPAGIEFECPHCGRLTRVPMTLAGKQGRCSGCRRVIEVPSGVPPSGRTPDPEDGLLEVLDARRASERVARRTSERREQARRPSEAAGEVEADDARRRASARREQARRPSEAAGQVQAEDVLGPASERREQVRRPSEVAGRVVADGDVGDDDEGSTARIDLRAAPQGPVPFRVWSRQVPVKVWIGLPAAVIVPALGIVLCVLGLRQARAGGMGVRLAWAGISIGSVIMAYNLALAAWIVLRR